MTSTFIYTILKKQVFCFFLFSTCFIISQNKIDGFIKDVENKPVDGANIILKNPENEQIATYTTSNNEGYFKLHIKKGTYLLKISYLGYETYLQNIEVLNTELQLSTIILKENSTELEEVIIKAENNGIIQKGNITQYKIDKFLNGTEENLKDVIKRLPGLGINENGKITANGKEIDRLLIDGENLYKRQHQLATENISSEMVKNAELIRNYKDFESINQNERTGITALNINIKDEFKNKFTGNIEAHLGIKEKYKIKASLFNFNKNIKFSLLPSSNNLGESTMSIEDYYALTDSDVRNNSKGKSKVVFSEIEDLPRFLKSDYKVKSKTNHFITLSSIANINKKTKIDFYGIFNNSKQTEFYNRKLLFNSNQTQHQINEDNSIKETNYFGVIQLKSIFKPNKNSVLTLNNQLNIDNTRQKKDILSNINNAASNIEEMYKPRKIIFNTELDFSKNINSNLFNTSLFFNYLKSEATNHINSNNPFLNITFNNNNYTTKQTIGKDLRETRYNINYTLNYNNLLVNFYNNTTFSNNNLTSNTNNLEEYLNDLSINQFSAKNGLELTLKLSKKINYSAGINYNYQTTNFNEIKNKANYLGVNSSLKSVFNDNNIAQLSYNYSNTKPTIDFLNDRFLIKDYRNLVQNENIKPNSLFPYHQISISHFVFKPKSRFSYIFNATYSLKEKSIGNNNINQENLFITKNKIIDRDNTFNAFIFMEKESKNIPFSIAGSFTYNNDYKNYYQDNIISNFKSENISSIIKLKSKFKESLIHFDLGLKYSKDVYNDEKNESIFIVTQPYLNLNGKIKKHTYWSLNSNFTRYKNLNSSRKIYNINPALKYKKQKSKWEVYLIGNNILNLNNRAIIENNSSPSFTEEKTTSILNGYLLIGCKFKY